MTAFAVDQIDHVELFVPDQYEAADWLGAVFGLRIVPEFEHWAESGPLMVSSVTGDTKLALFRGSPVAALPRTAFHRVAFRVGAAGFDAFVDRAPELDLRGEDGAPLGALTVVNHQQSFSVYFQDPWGHRFEVTTYETAEVSHRT